MGEFPGSIDYFVNEERVFIDALKNPVNWYAIVIHKTASNGPTTAEQQGSYFQTNSEWKSVHYVVGKDGHVVQCVLEKDGAGGNCCTENGFDMFWNEAPTSNLNMCTFSIEHVDTSSDNSQPLTAEQKAASFKLVAYLCHKYHISVNNIKGHNSIAPLSRKNCPGNYPWMELFLYLKGEGMGIPAGWHDDGKTLTAPNNIPVVLGFRDHIIGDSAWDAENVPLEKESYPQSVEESDISLGPGTVQTFRDCRLEYTEKRGVYLGPLGKEYLYVRQDRDNCRKIIAQLQWQIGSLQSGLPQQDFTALEASIQKVLTDLQVFKGK